MGITMDANTLAAVKEVAQWVGIVAIVYIGYRYMFGRN